MPESVRAAGATPNKFFKALSDGTRREILRLLERQECCVSEIVSRFESSQPTISRHLAVLKDANVVTCRRSGQRVIYELSGEALAQAAESLFRTLGSNSA